MTRANSAPAATAHSIMRRAASVRPVGVARRRASGRRSPGRRSRSRRARARGRRTAGRRSGARRASRRRRGRAPRPPPGTSRRAAAVRTKISPPIRASGRIAASDGRRESAGAAQQGARRTRRPCPPARSTVAQAEPASPQSKHVDEQQVEERRWRRSRRRRSRAACAGPRCRAGSPARRARSARTSSPIEPIRRYRTARSPVRPSPPMRSTSGTAKPAASTVRHDPDPGRQPQRLRGDAPGRLLLARARAGAPPARSCRR